MYLLIDEQTGMSVLPALFHNDMTMITSFYELFRLIANYK